MVRKLPEQKKSAPLSFRTTLETRRGLEAAARAHNHSLAEEVEDRLKRDLMFECPPWPLWPSWKPWPTKLSK